MSLSKLDTKSLKDEESSTSTSPPHSQPIIQDRSHKTHKNKNLKKHKKRKNKNKNKNKSYKSKKKLEYKSDLFDITMNINPLLNDKNDSFTYKEETKEDINIITPKSKHSKFSKSVPILKVGKVKKYSLKSKLSQIRLILTPQNIAFLIGGSCIVVYGMYLIVSTLPSAFTLGTILVTVGGLLIVIVICESLYSRFKLFCDEHGLISLVNSKILRKVMLNVSVLDIFKAIRESRLGIVDLWLSQILPLADYERLDMVNKLPQITRNVVTTNGLIYLTPLKVRRFVLPKNMRNLRKNNSLLNLRSEYNLRHPKYRKYVSSEYVPELATIPGSSPSASPKLGSKNEIDSDNSNDSDEKLEYEKITLKKEETIDPNETIIVRENSKLNINNETQTHSSSDSDEFGAPDIANEINLMPKSVVFSMLQYFKKKRNQIFGIRDINGNNIRENSNNLPNISNFLDPEGNIKENIIKLIHYFWSKPFNKLTNKQLIILVLFCNFTIIYLFYKSKRLRITLYKQFKNLIIFSILIVGIAAIIELGLRYKSKKSIKNGNNGNNNIRTIWSSKNGVTVVSDSDSSQNGQINV